MKKFAVSFVLTITFLAISGYSQGGCKGLTITQLANDFAKAFESKTMGTIDKTRPFLTQITIRIESSLAGDGDADQYYYKRLKNFTAFEKWMKSREIEDLPNRSSSPLISCKNGVCTYDVQGLLHNTLFLQKISFGYKKDKCPYIKSVFLIDGD